DPGAGAHIIRAIAHGDSGFWVGETDRAASARMAKSPVVRAEWQERGVIQEKPGAIAKWPVGHLTNVFPAFRAHDLHKFGRNQMHAVERAAIGQRGVDPRHRARIAMAVGRWKNGPAVAIVIVRDR